MISFYSRGLFKCDGFSWRQCELSFATGEKQTPTCSLLDPECTETGNLDTAVKLKTIGDSIQHCIQSQLCGHGGSGAA